MRAQGMEAAYDRPIVSPFSNRTPTRSTAIEVVLHRGASKQVGCLMRKRRESSQVLVGILGLHILNLGEETLLALRMNVIVMLSEADVERTGRGEKEA